MRDPLKCDLKVMTYWKNRDSEDQRFIVRRLLRTVSVSFPGNYWFAWENETEETHMPVGLTRLWGANAE